MKRQLATWGLLPRVALGPCMTGGVVHGERELSGVKPAPGASPGPANAALSTRTAPKTTTEWAATAD